MVNKKTVEAYFLQKTGGTYTEQSVHFLFDLLRREGIISNTANAELLASELATLVRDGSHLDISTKRLPEHIRAQINFSLQKTKKAKSKNRSNSQSAFDDLLASLDSDDPRFTMDTTMGLDFGSMEDLEADLKRRALDSISQTVFRHSQSRPAISPQYEERSDSDYENFLQSDLRNEQENSDDSMTGGQAFSESSKLMSSTRYKKNQSTQSISGDAQNQFMQTESAQNDLKPFEPSDMDSSIQASKLNINSAFESNENSLTNLPQFPNKDLAFQFSSNQLPANQFSLNQLSSNASNVSLEHQVLADIRLRAALMDAKEKIMSQRLSTLRDPVVLRALSMLDEKAMQLRANDLQGANVANANAEHGSYDSQMPQHGRLLHEHSAISQIKSQIEDIMSLQKSLAQLTSNNFSENNFAGSNSANGPANNRSDNENFSRGGEVKRLRTHVNSLQNQLQQLTEQIKSLVSPRTTAGSVANVNANFNVSKKVKPLKTSEVPSQQVPVQDILLRENYARQYNLNNSSSNNSFGNTNFDVASPASFGDGLQNPQGTDTPLLQRMYSLLSVGLRELPLAPKRAKHIYEQMQKSYTLLSDEEKQLIYPSIITFHAMVRDALGPQRSSK